MASNLMLELPPGCQIIEANIHGSSTSTQTARIVVALADGRREYYFLKVSVTLSRETDPLR
jgi:hypothetical protein